MIARRKHFVMLIENVVAPGEIAKNGIHDPGKIGFFHHIYDAPVRIRGIGLNRYDYGQHRLLPGAVDRNILGRSYEHLIRFVQSNDDILQTPVLIPVKESNVTLTFVRPR